MSIANLHGHLLTHGGGASEIEPLLDHSVVRVSTEGRPRMQAINVLDDDVAALKVAVDF